MSSEESFFKWIKELTNEFELNFKIDSHFIFCSSQISLMNSIEDRFIVYEDWWICKPEIIKSKIKSILGVSKKINGRQCILKKITKPDADAFLNENHIYGSTNSKIKYGLYFKDQLVSVITFANQRQFKDERSAELLRYCSKNDYSIIGGLGKFLKKYVDDYHPNSIMTYVDLDWGKGNSFIKLGFEPFEFKKPISFYISKYQYIRISERNFDDFINIENYYNIRNRGSIKMIKKIVDQ